MIAFYHFGQRRLMATGEVAIAAIVCYALWEGTTAEKALVASVILAVGLPFFLVWNIARLIIDLLRTEEPEDT